MKIIKYNKDNPGSEQEELVCENISEKNGKYIVELLNNIERQKPREIDWVDDYFEHKIHYKDRYRYSLEQDWYHIREVYM